MVSCVGVNLSKNIPEYAKITIHTHSAKEREMMCLREKREESKYQNS